MNLKISASILSADLSKLQEEVTELEELGVDYLHIDVMDRHFVRNLTFGPVLLQYLKTDLVLDIHLMVENPSVYIQDFKEVLMARGVDIGKCILTVHSEACVHLHRVLQEVKDAGFRVGVALNPASSLSLIEEVVEIVDQVLIMTVNPGFSGQKFIGSALNKVRELRANFSNLDIEVDGGVDAKTVKLCVEAGANILVSGSYLFNAKNRKEAIDSLRDFD